MTTTIRQYKRGDHVRTRDVGVAMWFLGYCADDRDCANTMMVGDDRKLHVQVCDLEPLNGDDCCWGCGQIGCAHGGSE